MKDIGLSLRSDERHWSRIRLYLTSRRCQRPTQPLSVLPAGDGLVCSQHRNKIDRIAESSAFAFGRADGDVEFLTITATLGEWRGEGVRKSLRPTRVARSRYLRFETR